MTSVELLERAARTLRDHAGTAEAWNLANNRPPAPWHIATHDWLLGPVADFCGLMSPAVALALADWLDAAAQHAWHMGSGGAALAVARAILREEP